MNEQKRHIRTIIDQTLELFKPIRIAYGYIEPSDTHLIKVTPKSIYESPMFQRFMGDKVFEFYEQFPHSNFAFITEGSLVEITNPEIAETNQVIPLPISVVLSEIETSVPMGYLTIEDLKKTIAMADNYFVPFVGLEPDSYVAHDFFPTANTVEVAPIAGEIISGNQFLAPDIQIFKLQSSIHDVSPDSLFGRLWAMLKHQQTERSRDVYVYQYSLAA
jgi:hypothetical protein